MARQIITGKSGLIEVRPKTTGVVYPAESGAWFKLAEVSTDAKLEITGETEEQERYAADDAVLSSTDKGSFSAKAFAWWRAGMVHKAASITPGSGYTSAPSASLAAPPLGGVQATGIVGIDPATGQIVEYFVTDEGENYASAPAVTLTGGGGTGGAVTVAINGYADAILFPLFKAGQMRVRWSPYGEGAASSKKPRYVFDFVREGMPMDAPPKGAWSIEFSGKATNIVREEY